jgi:hypothetical protein
VAAAGRWVLGEILLGGKLSRQRRCLGRRISVEDVVKAFSSLQWWISLGENLAHLGRAVLTRFSVTFFLRMPSLLQCTRAFTGWFDGERPCRC